MAKQCSYKKKGFRQTSMESNPYELDSMNTNFSKGTQASAEAIYGNPQGAMMVGNVQLQQQDTSAYSRPSGAMQQSSSIIPPINNTGYTGGTHNFTGSVGTVQNTQQNTAGYTATTSALGGSSDPGTVADINKFAVDTSGAPAGQGGFRTSPLGKLLVKDKKSYTEKLKKAGGQLDPNATTENNNSSGFVFNDQAENANKDKFMRIKKRMKKWEDRTSDGKTGVGKVLSGIGSIFKKKP